MEGLSEKLASFCLGFSVVGVLSMCTLYKCFVCVYIGSCVLCVCTLCSLA